MRELIVHQTDSRVYVDRTVTYNIAQSGLCERYSLEGYVGGVEGISDERRQGLDEEEEGGPAALISVPGGGYELSERRLQRVLVRCVLESGGGIFGSTTSKSLTTAASHLRVGGYLGTAILLGDREGSLYGSQVSEGDVAGNELPQDYPEAVNVGIAAVRFVSNDLGSHPHVCSRLRSELLAVVVTIY